MRVHDNLHVHAQNEPIKKNWVVVGKSPYHAARVTVSRNAFLSSRSEKTFTLTLIL